MQLIDSEAALTRHTQGLLQRDPVLAAIHGAGVRSPLRKRDGGFPGLISIIMAQQLSVASANAINRRLREAIRPLTPQMLLAAPPDDLAAAGLSQPKIRAVRAIAEAIVSGQLDLDALGDLSGEAAHAALAAVHGVGPWTADIYLLFCLGHPDVFPAGDLALQEAARQALNLERRPDAVLMGAIARRWSPHRGAAALLLWALYAVMRGREGVIGAAEGDATHLPAPQQSQWRPPRRPELAAMASAPGTHALSPPDLLEGMHAADRALRLAAAKAIRRSGPLDADAMRLVARRLSDESDRQVRRMLIAAAPDAAAGQDAVRLLIRPLLRTLSAPGGAAAERAAARRSLERIASRQTSLAPGIRRRLSEAASPTPERPR